MIHLLPITLFLIICVLLTVAALQHLEIKESHREIDELDSAHDRSETIRHAQGSELRRLQRLCPEVGIAPSAATKATVVKKGAAKPHKRRRSAKTR